MILVPSASISHYWANVYFHLEIRMDSRNSLEIELKIVWSHFKAHKIFMKLKIVFERRLDQKDFRNFLFSLPASNSEGFCLASNEINRLCITFANFHFFFISFACSKFLPYFRCLLTEVLIYI